MKETVSIIIPVYNAEEKLQLCLKSILKQDYPNFEVLLINDGSTDNSGKICDQYTQRDHRLKTFHQKNGGVSNARNKGIEHSTGTFILFVDSDDSLEPNCLSKLLEVPPADLTYMSSNVYYETGDSTSFHIHPLYATTQEEIEKEILHLKINPQGYVYFGYTWNKLFKSYIIKKHNIRFIDHLNFYEDDAFTLEYFKYVKTLRTISDCLYNYTVSSTGLTASSNSCEEFEMLIDSNLKNIKFITNTELYKYELGRLFSFLLQAIRQAQKQKRKEMYRHLIKKAHSFYLEYIRKHQVPIRKVYQKSNFSLFRLSIFLHKH